MQLCAEPTIHPSASVVRSTLGAWTYVAGQAKLDEVDLGDYSYLMERTQATYTSIGRFCSIASDVRLNPGNHPIGRPTSHHMTYRARMYGFAPADEDEFFQWRRSHRVVIGHDVWIGHGATVLPGVHVGNGAVIGTGAVVTKDVEPYVIVAGVPARPVRDRFPPEVARRLESTRWWDWSREQLKERFEDFSDLAVFLERYGSVPVCDRSSQSLEETDTAAGSAVSARHPGGA